MSDSTELTCKTCATSRGVRFCRNCTYLSCLNCLDTSTRLIFSCPNCLDQPTSDICGGCGSEAVIDAEVELKLCPVCQSSQIEDPEVLVTNIASDYFGVIKRVHEVNKEFLDLYTSFDLMVALVMFCRHAGLLGLPQMEMQLDTVSKAMKKLKKQAIDSLTSIRQEGLYDIRSHKYFKDVKLEHYRSLDGVLKNTEEKVQRHLDQIRHWIGEVSHRLDQLKPTAVFLRHHYDMLADISEYLPHDVHDVAAIVPPISMAIRTRHHKEQGECYIIFTGEYCIFLPARAIASSERVGGIKVTYADIRRRQRGTSLLKGTHMTFDLDQGEIIMSAPPQVLDKVEKYFGLVDAEEPYMVGSPKKIISIEAQAPDKNEYKRAATKFVTIFNEWLFDERVQQPDDKKKLDIPSITELKTQLDRLEKMYSNYNYQARHHQIPLDKYQDETSQIKDRYASIRDTLSSLSGHFGNFDNDESKFGS